MTNDLDDDDDDDDGGGGGGGDGGDGGYMHRLAFVPLRQGKPLLCLAEHVPQRRRRQRQQQAMIPIAWKNNTDASCHDDVIEDVIGRVRLLSCMYAACSCHSKIYSTKSKCFECRQITLWAVRALSRRMLRVVSPRTKGKHPVVQVRGGHAIVLCNGEPIGGDYMEQLDGLADKVPSAAAKTQVSEVTTNQNKSTDDWRGNIILRKGMILSFHDLHTDGLLEFQVLTVQRQSMRVIPDTEKQLQSIDCVRQWPKSYSTQSQMRNEHLVSECQTCTSQPLEETIFADSQFKPSVRVYFLALGQDLPRQRIAMLSEIATRRGAIVVQDVGLATHIVVSQYVETFAQIVDRLACQEDELETLVDKVSSTTWCTRIGIGMRVVLTTIWGNVVNHWIQNKLTFVLPVWISRAANSRLVPPSQLEIWHGRWCKRVSLFSQL